MLKNNKGFTLIELMVTLAIGVFLILGISGTYSAIQISTQTSKDLENAQEVIRYTSHVFTRSLKQTNQPLTISVGSQFPMIVQQQANTTSCLGVIEPDDYYETFTFDPPTLSCSLNKKSDDSVLKANTPLLTGINSLSPSVDNVNNLFTVIVLPEFLPASFDNGVQNGIQIDIALNALIFANAMNTVPIP